MSRSHSSLCLIALLALTAACRAAQAQSQERLAFSFAALGDTPYFAFEEVRLEKVIEQINTEDLAFVIHIGDIKSGRDRCDDKIYAKRKRLFDAFRHPFVLIPGDNDWTDCHRQAGGGYDPVERLRHFRDVFYLQNPPLGIERQSVDPAFADYRENMRWTMGRVLFVTLHVVGSNNNFGRTAEADAEYRNRSIADTYWLRESFALAREHDLPGLVLAIHADPRFELSPSAHARTGFSDFVRCLSEETARFGNPVLLIHGDGHVYRLDHPLRGTVSGMPVVNLTRLEVFGSPTVGWVKVTADLGSARLFDIKPQR
jgi:hypothetical protein